MADVKIVSKNSDGNEVVCYLKRPSPKETSKAKIYSNTFAASLLNTKDDNDKPSVILRSQIDTHLRTLGVWSEEDEEKVKSLAKEIQDKERQLARGGAGGTTKEKAKQTALDIIKLRDTQVEILSKRRELDRHTLEFQVEQANFDCLLSLCLKDEEGNLLFKSMDEYKEKETEQYAFDSAVELHKIIYGAEDYRKSLPEYQFLVKYKFMNDKYQWINKDGKPIDIETGHLLNEKGFWVDENNNLIDRNGNKIDENGNPVEQFVEFAE